MNQHDFAAEAERLARKAAKLTFAGVGEPAGYWHGKGRRGGVLISVRRGGRWLNVYLDEEQSGSVRLTDAPIKSSLPLFAQEYKSLPPVDAVLLLGSEAVGSFLESNGWERTVPFNDNFPSSIPGQYERLWQDNCPLYSSDVVAVTGGWHFPWSEGDWYELVESELVLWVLQDAEPWVEVFCKDGKFTVKQRIT